MLDPIRILKSPDTLGYMVQIGNEIPVEERVYVLPDGENTSQIFRLHVSYPKVERLSNVQQKEPTTD